MKSKFLSINAKDIIKGFIVAFLTALLTATYQAIQSNEIQFTWLFWQPVLITSAGAAIAYLLKNWLTNSEDDFVHTEKT